MRGNVEDWDPIARFRGNARRRREAIAKRRMMWLDSLKGVCIVLAPFAILLILARSAFKYGWY